MKIFRLLWHPHQKLWNWKLVTAITDDIQTTEPPKKFISWLLIYIDTTILFSRAISRRFIYYSRYFFKKLDSLPVVYIDIGTHTAANELSLMLNKVLPRYSKKYQAYGFEANIKSYNTVVEKFIGVDNVKLINKAVCNDIPENGVIRLYFHGDGHGDSIYRAGDNFCDVKAVKISCWIKENKIDIKNNIVIIRMNIEGAEFDVLQDLKEHEMLNYIDGYYGMWDDLSKIDEYKDAKMISFLNRNGISPLTFNERDFVSKYRLKAIEFDLATTIKFTIKS